MKIAVAQAIAIRHRGKAFEQVLPARFIEIFRFSDSAGEANLQTAETNRNLAMDRHVQPGHILKVIRCLFRSTAHSLGK